jgi:hypothetical protein
MSGSSACSETASEQFAFRSCSPVTKVHEGDSAIGIGIPLAAGTSSGGSCRGLASYGDARVVTAQDADAHRQSPRIESRGSEDERQLRLLGNGF